MLDELIRATLAQYAQLRRFPPERENQPITVWINQSEGGRCENERGK